MKEYPIKISEKQAKEMMKLVYIFDGYIHFETTRRRWREAGFIEMSALEKAREIKEDIRNNNQNFWSTEYVFKMVDFYEQAIEELQEATNDNET